MVDRQPAHRLPPPPPREDAGGEHQAGQHEDRRRSRHRLLPRRHRHPAVGCLRRPDGDQVLLLREPVDGVREQIRRCPAHRRRRRCSAKSESPKTTTRVSGFGASPAAGVLGAAAPSTGADTATAERHRPGLVAARLVHRDARVAAQRREVRLRPAAARLVSTIVCATRPFVPPSTGSMPRASG